MKQRESGSEGEKNETSLQTNLTVNPEKYMTQCSITYILLLCLYDVAATLFLQLHVSREWGLQHGGRMGGGWQHGTLL